MPATLLSSASWPLKRTVSALARKPLRIFRYVLSVSMNYFIPGSTSHQTCVSFESRAYLFADHQIRFALGASAAAHQLHHPKRNYPVCFGCQQHQRIEYPLPSARNKVKVRNCSGSASLIVKRLNAIGQETRVGTKFEVPEVPFAPRPLGPALRPWPCAELSQPRIEHALN